MLHVAGKEELMNNLKKHRKDLIAYEKELTKRKTEKAMKDTKELIAQLKAKASTDKSVVLKLEGDKSVLNEVLELFKVEMPTAAVFVLGVDENQDALTAMAASPECAVGALPANEWINHSMAVAQGKGGGKADRAQGAAK